jgi:hypothetical protein
MMSSDREQYEPILQQFVGRTCYGKNVCHSLKLRCEELADAAGRGYIWIDPPWLFRHHEQLITTSDFCPDYKNKDSIPRFRTWCKLFSPLAQTILMGYQFAPDGSLHLSFPDAYSLEAPMADIKRGDIDAWLLLDSCYLHWYARQIKPGKETTEV